MTRERSRLLNRLDKRFWAAVVVQPVAGSNPVVHPSPLPGRAVAVLAPRPAARPTLAIFQLLLGSANAAFSSRLLLGILYPADELVARQGCYVLPGIECRDIRHQRLAQVCR